MSLANVCTSSTRVCLALWSAMLTSFSPRGASYGIAPNYKATRRNRTGDLLITNSLEEQARATPSNQLRLKTSISSDARCSPLGAVRRGLVARR